VKTILVMLVAVVAGCSSPSQDPSATPSVVPSATPDPSPSASAPPRTATELLECDAGPSEVGGSGREVAFSGGETPDEALAAFLADPSFVIPHAGYEPLGRSGDRHAYGYRADGKVKVVVVISTRFGELVGARYAPDELRTCPESEFGAAAEFDDGRRVWAHRTDGSILTDIAGPGHCGWESARMLHVPNADGTLVKQYLRDPFGVFSDIPNLLDTYSEGVELPDDASDSGYRSPDGHELWFSEADTAAYVVTPEGVERWPRPADPIGCS
jgi:hypothetical protein